MTQSILYVKMNGSGSELFCLNNPLGFGEDSLLLAEESGLKGVSEKPAGYLELAETSEGCRIFL